MRSFGYSVLIGVVASLVVSFLAYLLFRENITSLIDRGVDILQIDDTLSQLDALAMDRGTGGTTTQPAQEARVACTEALEALETDISKHLAQVDEILGDLEAMPALTEGPGRVVGGKLVANPKQAVIAEVRAIRERMADRRVSIQELRGCVLALDGAWDAEMEGLIAAHAARIKSVSSETAKAALALRQRRDTMLKVLEQFGRR